MATSTLTAVINEALRREPLFGFAASFDAAPSSTQGTDLSEFNHSRLNQDEFDGQWWHRQTATVAADSYGLLPNGALTTSTGKITFGGAAKTDATLPYRITPFYPPNLQGAVQTMMRTHYLYTDVLLTLGPDFDMETAGVTNWTASGATLTKSTTAANVLFGTQSLRIAATGAGDYARSATIRVNPSTAIYTAAFCRADVGTVTLKLYDITNSAYIGSTTTPAYSGERFALMERHDTTPAGCEEVRVELTCTGASDDIYCSGIYGPIMPGIHDFDLQSWMIENYQVRLVRPTAYSLPISGSTNSYDARSRHYIGDLINNVDFTVETTPREANPNRLLIGDRAWESSWGGDGWGGVASAFTTKPVFITAARNWWDADAPSTASSTLFEASTTSMPFEEAVTATMHILYDLANAAKGGNDPYYRAKLAEYTYKDALQVIARTQPARVKSHTWHVVSA